MMNSELLELEWQNFAPSCERNKVPLLEVLSELSLAEQRVLELGSLSGQHACFMAPKLAVKEWQTSDLAYNLPPLTANIERHGRTLHQAMFPKPLALEVGESSHWPAAHYDAIFTANTLHIMSWQSVQQLFRHLPQVCKPGTRFMVYGPFKFGGDYTSESNAEFEIWLKERNSQSGIRDFEAVDELASNIGFTLKQNIDMPANNQLLVWEFN
tara:strand:+ start:525 stop:1160 length:636 start_codon:yes stop_codon:yes gene_type:complete